MDTLLLRISGNWGHFKKPETNNNPLTHDFLTKTALIGMVGAVLGKDREAMRPLFTQLSEDLKYGVVLEKPVKKQSWAFSLRRFAAGRSNLEVVGLSPRPFEFLKDPCFRVAIALTNERSRELYDTFAQLVCNSETHFDPILGLHNCPAEITFLERCEVEEAEGKFQTAGYVESA
jgi:CRISPR-associated protein Cas5 subtype I-B